MALNFEINQDELFGLLEIGEPTLKKRLEDQEGIEGVMKKVCVDPKVGLRLSETQSGFKTRREKYGKNQFPEQPTKSFFTLVFEALQDSTLIILMISAVVSLVLGVTVEDPRTGWIEGTAILAAVVIVCLVTAINDYQKELQFRALNKVKDDVLVPVFRETEPGLSAAVNVSIHEINVGDIVLLSAGAKIPADGLVIFANELEVNESELTGEPKAIHKNKNENYILYGGTKVMTGEGRMVITGVGIKSQWGHARKNFTKPPDPTPLQLKLTDTANLIGIIGTVSAGLTLLVLVIQWVLKNMAMENGFSFESFVEVVDFLIIAITIIVVAVPEGLPLAVTISLAYSMKKMMKDMNLVRRLESCETMGNVTSICSDKTGTLTENQMTVVAGYFLDNYYKEIPEKFDDKIMEIFGEGVATNSKAFWDGKQAVGSQTECALVNLLMKLKYPYIKFQKENEDKIVKTFTFSSARKRMSTIVKKNGNYRMHMKGASEIVFGKCSHFMDKEGGAQKLNESKENEIKGLIQKMASSGLRTLTLAYKDFTKTGKETFDEPDQFEKDLICIAIVGIKDPVRKEVPRAVKECQNAGITVRMVTGDNIETASHIARECGILTDGKAIEGYQWRNLSDEERKKLVPELQVIARSSPNDKLILVKALKEMGEIVSVTGDGTNDAPALKEANVGLSMGITGTDVAKEASAIVILDDNFKSIVNAVLWGRCVYDNIRKFLQFQLTVNFVALVLAFVSAITKKGSPLKAVQMLWVNLIMDTLAALALGTEPPTRDLLNRKPYAKTDSLLSNKMIRNILTQGAYQLSVLFFILYFGGSFFHYDISIPEQQVHLYTILFNSFVLCQVFNELNSRKIHDELNIFQGLFKNAIFIGILIFIVAVQFLVVTFGGKFFSTTPLSLDEWIISISIGAASIPLRYVFRLIKVPIEASQLPKKSKAQKKED
ncbi:cation transporting atpase [Anaeramoeba ignava]|uniref:Calcium-transporting ATPase n=1 Tax=Anaeramoeba ignava TaxID=1746090 RepID=A0A9Q0LTY0_ANAIG|nr:cation transporting atpase [Anaeramoeba ignava]|eukprot:Anaeramoba_ignava/a347679_1187.p1 GENE.a347679_1187~~a347679_1187.p1  ORF type:complete len:945 (+),score=322.50 a347679_1187:56-2890(+)